MIAEDEAMAGIEPKGTATADLSGMFAQAGEAQSNKVEPSAAEILVCQRKFIKDFDQRNTVAQETHKAGDDRYDSLDPAEAEAARARGRETPTR